MIKAVIFDIDGTLSDWGSSIDRALLEVQPKVPPAHRHRLPDHVRHAIEDYAVVLRDGRVVDRRHWLLLEDPTPPWRAALPGADPVDVDTVARRFQSLLEPVPFADVTTALDELHAHYPLGVLSNGLDPEQTLASIGLRSYFEAVVTAVAPWRKPHPQAFHRACEALDVTLAEAVYIGDSLLNDVEGSLRAGTTPIWIDRYDDRDFLPEGARRITSLEELPDLLRDMNG